MENRNLEDILKLLEENAEKMKSGKLSLDENINLYEQSVVLFNTASEMLNSAKQKIEIYNPEKQEVEEFVYE